MDKKLRPVVVVVNTDGEADPDRAALSFVSGLVGSMAAVESVAPLEAHVRRRIWSHVIAGEPNLYRELIERLQLALAEQFPWPDHYTLKDVHAMLRDDLRAMKDSIKFDTAEPWASGPGGIILAAQHARLVSMAATALHAVRWSMLRALGREEAPFVTPGPPSETFDRLKQGPACPDDPDGQHHQGCGCDAEEDGPEPDAAQQLVAGIDGTVDELLEHQRTLLTTMEQIGRILGRAVAIQRMGQVAAIRGWMAGQKEAEAQGPPPGADRSGDATARLQRISEATGGHHWLATYGGREIVIPATVLVTPEDYHPENWPVHTWRANPPWPLFHHFTPRGGVPGNDHPLARAWQLDRDGATAHGDRPGTARGVSVPGDLAYRFAVPCPICWPELSGTTTRPPRLKEED